MVARYARHSACQKGSTTTPWRRSAPATSENHSTCQFVSRMTGQCWNWHVILLAPGTAPPGPAGRWSHQRAREASLTPYTCHSQPTRRRRGYETPHDHRPHRLLLRVYSILWTRTAIVRLMQPLASSSALCTLMGSRPETGLPQTWKPRSVACCAAVAPAPVFPSSSRLCS